MAIIYPERNVLEGGLQKGLLSLICLLISSIVKALLLFTCKYSSISFFVSSLILLFKLLFRCIVSESIIRAFFDCSTTLYTLSTPIHIYLTFASAWACQRSTTQEACIQQPIFNHSLYCFWKWASVVLLFQSFISSSFSLWLSSSPSKIELSSLHLRNQF